MGFNILPGILIVFCASILEGLLGFGYIMLASPLLMFIFLPKLVVPIVLIQSTFNEFIMIYFLRSYIKKHVDIQRISKLTIASIVGIPLGTLILISVQGESIKMLTGTVIIVFSISQLMGYHRSINNENLALVITGLLSGMLAGSVAMSGPPVILFLTNLKVTKDCFKINIVIYFIIIGIIAILSMYLSGIINVHVIHLFFSLFPAMVLGVYVGISLSNKVNESAFRLITLIVIFISGVLAITSSLNSI